MRAFDFVRNTLAGIGLINTVYVLKTVIEEYLEKKTEENSLDKKFLELDEKIKYIEGVSQRIEQIQYTLVELRNIIGTPVEDKTTIDSLKQARNDFTEDIFY